MASSGDQDGSGGSKNQVGETKFMEKLNSIRMMLSQAKSESNPDQASQLMDDLSQQSKLAKELSELFDLVLAQDLTIAKISLMTELFVEAMALSTKRNVDIQKKIASLFPFEGNHADKEDK